MGKITTVGIDLAKNVFSVHAIDESGPGCVSQDDYSRAVDAHSGAVAAVLDRHGGVLWGARLGRRFQALGHTVRIMAARFLTPYRRNGKNDGNDAEAICEATQRPAAFPLGQHP